MAREPRPRPSRRTVVVVAVVTVVAIALLGGLGLSDSSPDPETGLPQAPASPSAASEAASPRQSPTPSVTDDPDAVQDPAASAPDAPPLVGEAGVDDPVGDVTDEAGDPAPDEPSAADLERVTLTGDGDALTVTFALAGPFPSEVESLLWSVELWVEAERAYTVGVQQVGGRTFAAVFDWADDKQVVLDDDAATVGDDAVTVVVPADALPRVEGPFSWWALTQRDAGFEDAAPDGGAAARVPFPAGED